MFLAPEIQDFMPDFQFSPSDLHLLLDDQMRISPPSLYHHLDNERCRMTWAAPISKTFCQSCVYNTRI